VRVGPSIPIRRRGGQGVGEGGIRKKKEERKIGVEVDDSRCGVKVKKGSNFI